MVLVFLVLFSTKLIWYDFRTINPGNSATLLYWSFLVYSILLCPFILWLLAKNIRPLLGSKLILSFFLINIYGVIIFFWHQNASIFVAQDVYKLMFFPAGFAAAMYLRESSLGFDRVFKWLLGYLFLFALIRLVIHVLASTHPIVYGTTHDILLISYAASLLWANPLLILNFVVLIALVGMGQKRTLYALFIFNYLYSFVYFSSVKNYLKTATIGIASVSIFFCGYAFYKNYDVEIFKRVGNVSTSIQSDIGIKSKRLREVVAGFDRMGESSSMPYFFGLGSGAFFFDPVDNPVTGVSIVHSFHFTPMAFYFRYGVFGIFFVIYLYANIMKVVLYKKLTDNNRLNFILKAVAMSSVIMSFIVYSVVDDILLGFIYGIFYIRRMKGVSCQIKCI